MYGTQSLPSYASCLPRTVLYSVLELIFCENVAGASYKYTILNKAQSNQYILTSTFLLPPSI